jgi:CheY-like chemotaxis protein
MGSTILLADDSITIQKVVNLTFADEGIDVVSVSNGDLAEKRLGEINPDLVLADIFMPGKNGYQLCEAIKQDPQFQNVPVVLLVGAFEPFDQAEARRVRADAHLTKPFESRTLVETVRRLVGENSGGSSKPVPRMTEATVEQPAAQEPAPAVTFTTAELNFSAMIADSGPRASVQSETADDSFLPVTDYVLDEFEGGSLTAHLQEPLTVLTEADPFDPIELSPGNGLAVGSPSASNMHATEVFFDSGRAGATESASSSDAFSFETSIATHGADLDASGDGHLRVPQTTPLADLATESEARLVSSETALETEPPTFLAPDEPLGDVLFEEDAKLQATPSESTASEGGHGLSPQFDLVSQDAQHPDWTSPRPEAYSTAQLDSIEMPPDVAQYLTANSEVSEVSEAKAAHHLQQPTFSTDVLFVEEEARFSPIDIEAFAVEEADSLADRVGGDHERGLAVEGVSPAAIEEIVRQVMAQVSDSIIREVAWEVVPDCVERVIERLARETLSKRM